MKKIKLEDINILINEYDETMVRLQRDDQNVYKNAIFSFLLSLFTVFIISCIIPKINPKIIFVVLLIIYFAFMFGVYNFFSIKGLNKILEQIREEYKINYKISAIKNNLEDIKFNFKKNKISELRFWYFIDYWKINKVFCYKMYLEYEIKNKDFLLKELKKIKPNKNTTIQILEKGKSLVVMAVTVLIYKFFPSAFEKSFEKLNNNENILLSIGDSIPIIILIIFILGFLIYIVMSIINFCYLNEKRLHIQKLKFIENCIYYLNNFEELKILETINELENQEDIYERVKISNDTGISDDLQLEIKESFGENVKKYLKEYQDISNNQTTENNEELKNRFSKLLISIEIEKNLCRNTRIIKINKKKEEIYRKISKISNDIILEELQIDVEENFGEITKKYLKKYQDISNNQTIENNEELKNRFSKLLISVEIEKNLYKIEKVTKILAKIEKQEEIYKKVSKITNGIISEELQQDINQNYGEVSKKYLEEYSNQEISDEEKQNKLSKLLISLETEKDFYKESKIIRNNENKKIEFFEIIKKFLGEKLIKIIDWFFKFLVVVLAIFGFWRLCEIFIQNFQNIENKKIEYVLHNSTESDIVIKMNSNSKKINIPKGDKYPRDGSNPKIEKDKINIESNKKCEIPFDKIKTKNKIEIEFKNDGSCGLK